MTALPAVYPNIEAICPVGAFISSRNGCSSGGTSPDFSNSSMKGLSLGAKARPITLSSISIPHLITPTMKLCKASPHAIRQFSTVPVILSAIPILSPKPFKEFV
ncbi:hypothetical protein ES705_44172 [subsurface metagenome]